MAGVVAICIGNWSEHTLAGANIYARLVDGHIVAIFVGKRILDCHNCSLLVFHNIIMNVPVLKLSASGVFIPFQLRLI